MAVKKSAELIANLNAENTKAKWLSRLAPEVVETIHEVIDAQIRGECGATMSRVHEYLTEQGILPTDLPRTTFVDYARRRKKELENVQKQG